MDLKTKKVGKVFIIVLEGTLNVHISNSVEQSISDIIDQGEKYLLIDLKKVDHLSSSGLRIFIGALRKLKSIDGVLKIANMNDRVKEIFKVVDLLDFFEVFNSVDEALPTF